MAQNDLIKRLKVKLKSDEFLSRDDRNLLVSVLNDYVLLREENKYLTNNVNK